MPLHFAASSRNATRQASAGMVSATDHVSRAASSRWLTTTRIVWGVLVANELYGGSVPVLVVPHAGACFVCRHPRPDSSGKSFARRSNPSSTSKSIVENSPFMACSSISLGAPPLEGCGERLPAWRRRRHLRVAFRSSQRASCHLRRGLSSWPGRGDARRQSIVSVASSASVRMACSLSCWSLTHCAASGHSSSSSRFQCR